VFNEAEPVMGPRRRRVLPDETGVIYRADNTCVLWVFTDDRQIKFDEATEVEMSFQLMISFSQFFPGFRAPSEHYILG
jgi:hypothetical protein